MTVRRNRAFGRGCVTVTTNRCPNCPSSPRLTVDRYGFEICGLCGHGVPTTDTKADWP